MARNAGTLGRGVPIAVISAAAFGLSGPMAKSLMDAGWSPGAAVLFRIGVGAIVLVGPVVVLAWPSRGRILAAHRRLLVGYGVIAVAGAQIGFFNAVKTLPVGVALLIEYLAPVLVVAWLWLTRGQRPTLLTFAGGATAMAGLVLVLDVTGGGDLDVVGVAWALWAAVCLTGYFLMSAEVHDDLSPVLTIGVGMIVGAIVVCVAGLAGMLPMTFTSASTELGGRTLPWWAPALGLALISSVFSYLTGIIAVRALGSRLASFVGLVEVLFAVLAAWLLLAQMPTGQQVVGGCLIIAGVVGVRLGEPEPEASLLDECRGAEPLPARR